MARANTTKRSRRRSYAATLPESGFLRLPQIIGDAELGLPAIIPVSKSTWWQGVKEGRFPQPVKLSARVTAWRVADVRALEAATLT
jgi:predicted DNA-binding transcriptional regulator AlpA